MKTVKFTKFRYILMLLTATLFAVACQGPKKMSKAVSQISLKNDPEVLEVHGDSVKINVRGKFPPKTFAKNASVRFQPVLSYGDGMERPLKPLYLIGEKAEKKEENTKVIKYKEGGSFVYEDKFEYTPEMKSSNLSLDYTVKFNSRYDDLAQCITDTTSADIKGTITTSLTVKPTDDVYYYNDYRPAGGSRSIIFYYVINESRLRDSVKKGPTMRQLRTLAADTSFRFNNVVLMSYASPDGEVKLNQNLVQGRAESAFKLVNEELKRLGVKSVQDSNMVKRPDINYEDWDGLRRMVNRYEFEGKQEVIDVLNSNMSFEDKEKNLRKLSSWTYLTKNILPRLRRTEVVFSGSFPNRKVEDLKMMKDSSQMDNMTRKELVLLADQVEDTASRLEIYEYMGKRFPDDWAGMNNYAALKLKQGEYKLADSLFEGLKVKFPNNDTILNNLGVAKRFLRKYDDAKDLYNTAARGGINESNNLGILYIKYGDYENSVKSFESDRCDYNVALAYTLKGDYDVALQKIECIEDKNADVYYLRAIVAARQGDKDNMTTSLTRAVQMQPELHDLAKGDLEFRKYNQTAEFKRAINP